MNLPTKLDHSWYSTIFFSLVKFNLDKNKTVNEHTNNEQQKFFYDKDKFLILSKNYV